MTSLFVSPKVLEEPSDDKLAWAVIEPAWQVVNIYDGPEALEETMRPLTRGQRALLAIQWCISETLNGGFHQFFTNPTSVLADEAAAGLRLIGASRTANVLGAAVSLFAEAPPEADSTAPDFDEAQDQDQFYAFLDRYDPLNEEFYLLMEEEIYPLAAAYVRANPHEFVL